MMKDDDNMLRNMFFTILRHHAPKLASKLDVVYALSSAWTMSESSSDFDMLEQRLKDLSPDELVMVSPEATWQPPLTCGPLSGNSWVAEIGQDTCKNCRGDRALIN